MSKCVQASIVVRFGITAQANRLTVKYRGNALGTRMTMVPSVPAFQRTTFKHLYINPYNSETDVPVSTLSERS